MAVKDNVDELIKELNLKGTTYEIPQSNSESRKLLDDLYGDITADYEYNAAEDPVYAAEKKAYEREADRTMRDTLAQANTKTNGFTNSAAITAASQARDYTMSQFNDRAAELEDRAYTKRQNQISMKMQLLSALESMEATERANYLDELDRIEAKEKERQEEEKAAQETAQSEARQMVSDMISMGQVPSDELLNATGLSKEYLNAQIKNMFNNMDVTEMQRYLNTQGYSLDVDGVWGPKTESAYKAVFGTSSGRQTGSYGTSSGSTSSGTKSTGTKKSTTTPTSAQTASAYLQIMKDISNGNYDNADSMIDEYEAYMNDFQKADIAAAIATKQGKKIKLGV